MWTPLQRHMTSYLLWPVLRHTSVFHQAPLQGTTTDNVSLRNLTFSPQANSSDVSNTSRILASVLHRSRLEPPVFAGDGHVSPEDWLQ